MLLEVKLAKDHAQLGSRGDSILVNDGYIVAVKKAGDGTSIMYLDLSDLGSFSEVYIEESYEGWYMLRLNI